MKKKMNFVIFLAYFTHIFIMSLMSQFNLVFISSTLSNYVFILSLALSFMYLKAFLSLDDEKKKYHMIIQPLLYLACFKFRIILISSLMGIHVLRRYERTAFNKNMKIIYLGIMIFTIFNFIFIPTLFSAAQEAQFNEFKVYDNPEGSYLLRVENYERSTYETPKKIDLKFYQRYFKIFISEVDWVKMNYPANLEVEWITSNKIRINNLTYEIQSGYVDVLEE